MSAISGKSNKKRQHYLPRFFLEGFAVKNKFNVLLRVNDKDNPKQLRSISINSIGYESYLYESEILRSDCRADKGEKLQQMPTFIENHLSEIETQLSKYFKWSLEVIDNWKNHRSLARSQETLIRTILSYLIVSITKRSPSAIAKAKASKDKWIKGLAEQGLSTSHDIQRMLKEKYNRPLIDNEIIDMDAMAEQIAVFSNVHPFYHEDTGLMFAHQTNREVFLLSISNMLLLKTIRKRPFIGVSEPQIMYFPTVKPKSTYYSTAPREMAYYFPLSSTLALLCTPGYPPFFSWKSISYRELKTLNKHIVNKSRWQLAFCENSDYLFH